MQVHSLSYDLDQRQWSSRFPAGDSPRTLVMLFGAAAMASRSEVFVEVARAYPRSLVIGCSTAGEIQGPTVRDRSLAVTVTRFDRTDLQLVSTELAGVHDSERAGIDLGTRLAEKPNLRAVLVLCDGLAVNGSTLASALVSAVGPNVTVTGGLAADGFDFKQTWLTIGGSIKSGVAAAVGFYGPNIVVGHGISRDWIAQPKEWVITRCEGNFVFELDYQPAIEVYRAALADRADELPEVAIWYPLAVRVGAEAPITRTVIGIDEAEGALVLAGGVRHGQSAQLLNADLEDLIEGGARAASGVAKTGAPVSVDCLALAISCFGRRKILGSWSSEELVAVREGLHALRTTVTGFYSYGQIAADEGPITLHNQTLSLTVFSESRPVETAPARAVRPPLPTANGYTVRSAVFDARSSAWTTPLPELDSNRTLVLAFGAPELGGSAAIETLRTTYPTSTILGCSTAGEISGATISDRTMVVSVTRFAKTDLRLACVPITSDAVETGRRLANQLTAPNLQGVLVFADGLQVNATELVQGINEVFTGSIPVIGGLAGDGSAFRETWVLAGSQLGPRMVVAVGLYGAHVVIGHGARGGWDRFGMKRTVTKAEGNVLYELDGRPALQIYKEYLGDRASQLPASALSLPLAVRDPVTDAQVVRTVVAIDEARESVRFAGTIPVGHTTQFMKADVERLINGSTHAALMASENGAPASPECLVLAVSCSGRRHMLGAHTEDEVEALADTFRSDRVQVTGFYAYGELAPGADGRCELHNQAMALAVISEAVAPLSRAARPLAKAASRTTGPVALLPVPDAVVEPATDDPPPVEEVRAQAQPGAVSVSVPPEAPRGAIVRLPRPNIGEITIKESVLDSVKIVKIGGRITEAFKGEAVARTLVGRVILDLGEIHRITSFGVREWLAMFQAATGLTECYFARCSEAVVNQLTMIRAFDGGARILSFFTPYLCEGCNKPFERLLDFQYDRAEIRSVTPEAVRCPRCNEHGKFDDDPRSYFAFFGEHDSPLRPDVKAAHDQLCAQDQTRPAEEVEKIVDGNVTRVRLAGRLSLNIRWRKVFENIDGEIVVDLSGITAIETSGLQSLDVHLRTEIASDRSIMIDHAPLALLERLVQRPAKGITVLSAMVAGHCGSCGVARSASIRLDHYRDDRARSLLVNCKRCDRRLEIKVDPVIESYVASASAPVVAVPVVAPAEIPVLLLPARARSTRAPKVIAGVIGAVVVLIIGWKLFGGESPPHAAPVVVPDAAVAVVVKAEEPSWKAPPDLPPGWADRPFTTDRENVYLVGQGEAESIDAALPAAREYATTVLVRQLGEDIAASATGRFAATRAAPQIGATALATFDSQYGNLTTFERIDLATRAAGGKLRVFVRFKLPRVSYERMLAAYRDTAPFRGMTVALMFPTLAESLRAKSGLLVVAVAPGSPADLAKIVAGDAINRVGTEPVNSLAGFRAATKRAWMQPDVRETLTLDIERGGAIQPAFVGLRKGP